METTERRQGVEVVASVAGTRDGSGAADHDVPFRFGYRPSARWTYPFSIWQYSRLLMLRGRVQDGAYADDRCGER